MGRLNPLIADGQVHGGVAHVIAGALFEDLIYDLGDDRTIGDPAAVLDAVSDALASLAVAIGETRATPERSAVTSSKLGGIG